MGCELRAAAGVTGARSGGLIPEVAADTSSDRHPQ